MVITVPDHKSRLLLLQVKSFLEDGGIPVRMEDSLEILAILEAAEKSIRSGRPEALEL